jgi:hypothetical protein
MVTFCKCNKKTIIMSNVVTNETIIDKVYCVGLNVAKSSLLVVNVSQ